MQEIDFLLKGCPMNTTNDFEGKNILLTGGAGFIGSHLAERLISMGSKITIVDNFITGNQSNLDFASRLSHLSIIEADVSNPIDTYLPADLKIDGIFHLASPASPKGYGEHPRETYKVNGFGTHYLAEFAAKNNIPMLYTSTSESYGDPQKHPQQETYWGNVNPVGPRACYDESKRFGEMVVSTWTREFGLDGRIVRIFNTYGPRMDAKDGRVIPNFITQALSGQPLTVYGDGSQTRSFCYVSDLVEYIIRAFTCDEARGNVINIGNPDEYTMLDFAKKIIKLTNSQSSIVYQDLPLDDPTRRRPDISKAKEILGYEPAVGLDEGLAKTIEWFKSQA